MRFLKSSRFALVLILMAHISACGPLAFNSTKQDKITPPTRVERTYSEVNANVVADPQLEAIIAPYRENLEKQMNVVVAQAPEAITLQYNPGTMESGLGNLTADIVRARAALEMRQRVDIAILNRGGLRTNINKGKVTVGNVFELMPFENTVVVLKLDGKQVFKLADELAARGGEAISGLRFRIENGKATEVLVGDQPINMTDTYLVATNNYLAAGGGNMPTLWEPIESKELNLMLRDVFIEAFKNMGTLVPKFDQRVRGAENNE